MPRIKRFHSRQKRRVHCPNGGPLRGRKRRLSFEPLETRAAPGGSILEMLSLGALFADLDLFRAADDGGVHARFPLRKDHFLHRRPHSRRKRPGACGARACPGFCAACGNATRAPASQH